MPLLIVLIAILAALVLFVQQNWSPSLALVFLGNSTKTLPLAMWMLGAFVLGAFTTVILTGLMRFAGYQIAQQFMDADEPDEPLRQPAAPRRYNRTDKGDDDDDWADEDWVEDGDDRANARSTSSRITPESTDDDDDRPESSPQDSVREKTEPLTDSPRSSIDPPRDYERRQQPQRTTQDGSAYSYSYRESARSGVGKTEAVYDAEFRGWIPPHSPETADQSGNWDENAPDIPEPEEEEEVWDGAEEEDWSRDRDRDDDWADDDTRTSKRR